MRIRRDAAIVAAAAAATFANSLANGFAFDDEFIISGNARVHQLADQAAIWLTPYWPGFGEAAGLYRPLAIFAYALEWFAGGGAPWVFHATNVVLHVVASVLALVLLRRLVSPGAALFGAVLFAVHPVHAEAVANAVGQAELLAGAAMLGACVLLVERTHTALSFKRLSATAALYAIAMLAKESAIVLPALLIALDAALAGLRRNDDSTEPRARRHDEGAAGHAAAIALPLLVLAATAGAYLWLRFSAIGSLAGSDPAPSLPFLQTSQRWLVALQTWPEYLRLLVFPLDLSADYAPDVIDPATGLTPAVILGGLLCATTIVLASFTPRRPAIGLPAAWFLIAILPVSNLIVPIGVVLAERTLYVPSFAIALVAAFAAQRIAGTRALTAAVPRARIARMAAATLLLAFAVRSVVRNPDWKNTRAYWSALVRDHPESYHAQWGMASHMFVTGNTERGVWYLQLAVETWPDDAALLRELGRHYTRRDESARAIPLLERARELGRLPLASALHLGLAYLDTRRFTDALAIADTAALASTENASVPTAGIAVLRARALEGLGRYSDAAAVWQSALHALPGRSFTWWVMTARALARAGDVTGALAAADSAQLLVAATGEADSRAAPTGSALGEGIEQAERVGQLRAAIVAGCYDRGRGERKDRMRTPGGEFTCTDPLEDWAIVPTEQGIAVKTGTESR
ncbi:MAG: tetratricopeptide repeat protein [Longimicrobiales bacterium]